jgi:hypothetical protein
MWSLQRARGNPEFFVEGATHVATYYYIFKFKISILKNYAINIIAT